MTVALFAESYLRSAYRYCRVLAQTIKFSSSAVSKNASVYYKPQFKAIPSSILKCHNFICKSKDIGRQALSFNGSKDPPVFLIFRTFTSCPRNYAPAGGGSGKLLKSNKTGLIYIVAVFIFMVGGAYAGVPLYKVFCQATGLGGQAIVGHDMEKVETMEKVDKLIKVRFNADVASSMRWNFKPQQTEVTVAPGETALAFYTATNPTNKPIIGISTYNVLPFEAGQYFNKIQCFCFEEQRLNPNEQVDMPVFFYIDPEFAEDPKLEAVQQITLSYTFFEAKEGLQLPLPGYPQPHDPPVSPAS